MSGFQKNGMMALEKMYKKLPPQNWVNIDFINVTYTIVKAQRLLSGAMKNKQLPYKGMMPLEEIWW